MAPDGFDYSEGESPAQYLARKYPHLTRGDWFSVRELLEQIQGDDATILFKSVNLRKKLKNASPDCYRHEPPNSKKGLRICLTQSTLELFCHPTWADVAHVKYVVERRDKRRAHAPIDEMVNC
jgi:hypothetical protein